ncbi:MAG: 16S rRNA (guanine(966)-N(2))-methyltransferase RsmD [Gammaproteobacteria bacterium]|nr:16S rRNA (guanine(966)-N(2))-methyltransferase RsmD [Gammaproteobacteria bacterium]
MQKRATRQGGKPPGSVRIIGGEWRGRRIEVAPGPGIRPTPDRVRETLFNWLAPVLPGMHCLDLYAGTGVLGLEALSRGAAACWFVEQDADAARPLEAVLERLAGAGSAQGHARGRVLRADARRWLAGPPPRNFDLVFLDPPYQADELGNLCTLLARGWLAPHAWVYLETSRNKALPALPEGWQLHREREAGEVRFALARLAG